MKYTITVIALIVLFGLLIWATHESASEERANLVETVETKENQ